MRPVHMTRSTVCTVVARTAGILQFLQHAKSSFTATCLFRGHHQWQRQLPLERVVCMPRMNVCMVQVSKMQKQMGKRVKSTPKVSEPQLAAENSAVAIADVDQLHMQVEGVEDIIAMLR